jgi:hypothetical protein
MNKKEKTSREKQLLLFQDTRGSTGVGEYKSRKFEKAQKALAKGVGKQVTFDMSFIEKERVNISFLRPLSFSFSPSLDKLHHGRKFQCLSFILSHGC